VANVNASTLLISNDSEDGQADSVLGGDVHVPLDSKSNLLVRYRGVKRTFPYVSAVDVLNGRADSSTFADKVVFVGTSALGTREVVSTPLDTIFTGVEVQATVADNLLRRDFLHRPESAVTLETLIVLIFGVLTALLTSRFGLAAGAVCAAVSLAAVWTGAILLLTRTGAVLSPLFPTIGLSSAIACMTGAHVVLERLRADRASRDTVAARRMMVQGLLALVEIKDAETGRHSRQTQQYTRVLAQELTSHPDFRDYLTRERIDLLSTLAPLHDIGKVGVPDRLLEKPGALTDDELLEMRKHPEKGRDALLKAMREAGASDDMTLLTIAMDIVYTHHEKWDGTGYPQGLRGTEIPIAGRLIALVDVYDAAHSRRVYQKPMQHDDVVAFIRSGRGTHFDPAVVDAFVKVSPVMEELSRAQ
jgi:adenylate cyclase